MRLVQLILCLLSTGFVKSSVLQLRRFEVVKDVDVEDKTEECQNKNMKLVTLYDDNDAKLAVNLSSNWLPTAWVGLQKILNNSGDIPMCPSTSGLRNCSDPLYFKCNGRSDNLTRGVALNWCAAKQHCHYHSLGDLATNESSANTTLWISGNITDNWRWEDGGCSTYRKWKEIPIGNHAAVTDEGPSLKSSNSDSFPAVCSTGDLRIVVPEEKKTWEEALQYCDTHHSGLLQIPTKDHQDSVEQWLNVIEGNKNNRGPFWVGLRQSQVFGFWIWKDTMVSTSNWENGMPTLPLSHECGVIVGPQWKWRDHNCLHRLHFICQENIEYKLNP